MPLLKNALQCIQVGIEDYESGKAERSGSSVRNIHAGLLLLLKERLRRLSPSGSNDCLLMESRR